MDKIFAKQKSKKYLSTINTSLTNPSIFTADFLLHYLTEKPN
ncbi:hypothetical protein NEOC65_001225 [Neochlamydia sp. AcF65]|nr:hypothetical protein [Neochlamydia sp. AcF65]